MRHIIKKVIFRRVASYDFVADISGRTILFHLLHVYFKDLLIYSSHKEKIQVSDFYFDELEIHCTL